MKCSDNSEEAIWNSKILVCSHSFYLLQLMQWHSCCQNYSCLAMFNAFCSCFIDNIVRVLSFSTHSNVTSQAAVTYVRYSVGIMQNTEAEFYNFFLPSLLSSFFSFFLKYRFPKQINKTCSIWESDFFKKIS